MQRGFTPLSHSITYTHRHRYDRERQQTTNYRWNIGTIDTGELAELAIVHGNKDEETTGTAIWSNVEIYDTVRSEAYLGCFRDSDFSNTVTHVEADVSVDECWLWCANQQKDHFLIDSSGACKCVTTSNVNLANGYNTGCSCGGGPQSTGTVCLYEVVSKTSFVAYGPPNLKIYLLT